MTGTQAAARPHGRVGRATFALAALLGLGLIWAQVSGGWAAATRLLEQVRGGDPGPLLVNAEHPLPEGFATPELVPLVDKVPVAHNGVAVAEQVEKPLLALFAAARKAGLKNLYVISGYRSAQEQQELWDASTDRSYVQPAGHSEHQTGLAVDLGDLKVGNKGFAASKAGRWLAKNAWKHGFILRYPAGKEEITGISYEPWHFRYVGKEVAKACHDQGLTLEEYVAGRQHTAGSG
ncbi:MAG: M15 family metallopeptidase [Propionicimonas sp.]|uniref:M15 family metallopeptidase n=1 Tax=Propionicimonas sp. TaxID=1955623 RepID=UPI002B204FBA|nr:M15 family metallopeptidase [Propionicimonas sp.]MEA4944210.1 M15 family metallopeptidase [Propionicimonas sp.]